MQIGVPTETMTGETRVAAAPETAKKLKAEGHTLKIQSGAGIRAAVTDEAYAAAGSPFLIPLRKRCLAAVRSATTQD
jgi:H+-translocating NAD(P) transhydrogenase subunit alpha